MTPLYRLLPCCHRVMGRVRRCTATAAPLRSADRRCATAAQVEYVGPPPVVGQI